MYKGLLEKYKEYLLVIDKILMILFVEGNILFILLLNLFKELGVILYGKYEGLNLIGFFKDCGMVMVVVKVKEEGVEVVICVFIGNIFVVVVVYVICVGLKVYIVILEGKVVLGKLV